MFYVYVIESGLDGSIYIGKTSDLKSRPEFHNSVELNKGITKRKIPWDYYFVMEVSNARIAGAIENHIKRMKSRRYIENLRKYPEIGKKLIEKYS
jgi:putative endonuclease